MHRRPPLQAWTEDLAPYKPRDAKRTQFCGERPSNASSGGGVKRVFEACAY